MKVVWNRVTRFSIGVAIVLFLSLYVLAFWTGRWYQQLKDGDRVANYRAAHAVTISQ